MNAPRHKAAGFTLVELLVTCSLIAILLGMSVGALARVGRSSVLGASERIIRASLLRARGEAQDLRSPCRVVVTPGGKSGPPSVTQVLTRHGVSWHFEQEGGSVLGGRNRRGTLRGAQSAPGGSLRRCAVFGGDGSVVAEKDPLLDPRGGFRVILDLWPAKESEGPVASFGDSFVLEIQDDGAVFGRITCTGDATVELKTAPDTVPKMRWTKLEFRYDGVTVELRVNNVLLAAKAEKRQLAPPTGQERFRVGGRGFQGRIDEVRYDTLGLGETQDLDPSVEIGFQGPIFIRYDEEGRLDPRFHQGPVVIPLLFEGETVTVTVEGSGVVR